MPETDVSDLMALDLEYRLTVAHRMNCECAPYLIRRREALIPATITQARKDDADPVDTFAAFARRVHARHERGLPLSEVERGSE